MKKTLAIACSLAAAPVLAHHGVAGVGAAALEGPGAPVESATSAVLPEGGTLRFDGRRGAGRTVELSVSDTGTGIPPDALARIFDLYFTTRAGGTGLGLSMVYRTVHLHDGTIEVESTPGRGAAFRVQLPQA